MVTYFIFLLSFKYININTYLVMIDVGQGDSIIVKNYFGENILFDAGSKENSAKNIIIPYLKSIGVTTIDKFVDSITPNDYTIYCGKMTYCGYNPSQTIKELAFTKSHHFSNEEELRFYFEPQKNSCRKELSDSIFIELPMLLYVNCGNVIDEVILSPFIKDGAADMICDFLNRTEDLAKCSIKKSNIRLQ